MSVPLSSPLNPRSKRIFLSVLANNEKLGAIFLFEFDSNSSTRYKEKLKLADSESTN